MSGKRRFFTLMAGNAGLILSGNLRRVNIFQVLRLKLPINFFLLFFSWAKIMDEQTDCARGQVRVVRPFQAAFPA